ncbi:Protein tas, partial [Cucurbita argyrosperma subsp. sororia]
MAISTTASNYCLVSSFRSTNSSTRQNRVRRICVCAKKSNTSSLQYRKLGDSDLLISEVTLGTVSIFVRMHFLFLLLLKNTAEAYPVPMKQETQGRTDIYIGNWLKSKPRDKIILATKVCGYSERSPYLREKAEVLRVDRYNIRESVEKSLKRLNTDYIDLLQIHWPDRYVALFGDFSYDSSKWRPSVPFVEQLKAFQELIEEGKIRYIGVSNETSYGVMEFVHTAKIEGLPKIISIQNNYSLLNRCRFEVDLAEVCHPNNYNIGLLGYSPLGGGTLSGKYLDGSFQGTGKGRLNLFPGFMDRYTKSLAKVATAEYVQLAEKHGLTPVQLALGFARDRPFMTSSIIGATSMDQLREDLDAFTSTERPLPAEVMADIEAIFRRYKDPAI